MDFMVFLFGIILTREKVGMTQENDDMIDEVNCKVEANTICTVQENNML